ncbi:dihydroxyacetone kinase phosphoryl donor subunit DhaM [Listeria welshimeri]|uniref:dihydroxyacetone kinase phosphoryl donor subunit DhaM n=1 Tax=Listeria welshimeri TaxID=1643 RepID=UPI001888956A|nr:dihydroxyacetone kinase phosphoryl donor subunit DhaM [Listeria welshimeri]MBF2677148.1 PTS-dependent dihydroxyacetone kinase phosphotransferase subunit DhaM [Listeria welshimeri]
MSQYGIVIVSHVPEIASGIKRLIEQVASNVCVTIAGGIEDNDIGTSIEKINHAMKANSASELLAFYDLGSAKMNLELCSELTEKEIHLFNVPIVEGAYSAAALAEVGVSIEEISKQLQDIIIK